MAKFAVYLHAKRSPFTFHYIKKQLFIHSKFFRYFCDNNKYRFFNALEILANCALATCPPFCLGGARMADGIVAFHVAFHH